LFRSVIPPTLTFDNQFELYISDNQCNSFDVLVETIVSTNEYVFEPDPVPCFSIQGIDVAEALDPDDPRAFVTGVTFNSTGSAEIEQVPIIQQIPDGATGVPGPLPVFGAAAAFGYSRKLRKRIARSKAVPVASAID
jgi:hypothetical protein